MRKQTNEPVSVDGIEFDALISSDEDFQATAPTYPTEQGFSVSDTVVLDPFKLNMTLIVSAAPVTWKSRHGNGANRVNSVCERLISLYKSKKLITVETSEKSYENMLITSLKISKTNEGMYSREIPITFTEVTITETKTGTVSYPMSGTTTAVAGVARTKKVASKKSTNSKSERKTGQKASSRGIATEAFEKREVAKAEKEKNNNSTSKQAYSALVSSGKKKVATLNTAPETQAKVKSIIAEYQKVNGTKGRASDSLTAGKAGKSGGGSGHGF